MVHVVKCQPFSASSWKTQAKCCLQINQLNKVIKEWAISVNSLNTNIPEKFSIDTKGVLTYYLT